MSNTIAIIKLHFCRSFLSRNFQFLDNLFCWKNRFFQRWFPDIKLYDRTKADELIKNFHTMKFYRTGPCVLHVFWQVDNILFSCVRFFSQEKIVTNRWGQKLFISADWNGSFLIYYIFTAAVLKPTVMTKVITCQAWKRRRTWISCCFGVIFYRRSRKRHTRWWNRLWRRCPIPCWHPS